MAFEWKEVLTYGLGTYQRPTWEVYDSITKKPVTITGASFFVLDSADAVVDSGVASYANNKTFADSRVGSVVQAVLDLRSSIWSVGSFKLVFRVSVSSGESGDLIIPFIVRDNDGV